MVRNRIVDAFAALALALGTFALNGPAGAAQATLAARPKVGQCRNLTPAQANGVSDTSAPIPCSRPHTARTFAVADVPTNVHYKTLNYAGLYSVGLRVCIPRFWKTLGSTATTRDQSAFTYVFFAPTKAQRANGARWVRCDLTMQGGNGFLPLPATPSPVLKNGITTSTRRCLDSQNLRTNCSSAHIRRSRTAFVVKSQTYQSHAQFIATAERRCPHADTFYTRPDKTTWNLGDHVIVCYLTTTS